MCVGFRVGDGCRGEKKEGFRVWVGEVGVVGFFLFFILVGIVEFFFFRKIFR